MKTLIVIIFMAMASLTTRAQAPAADFDVNILMQPASIALNNLGNLNISTCNNGNLGIVANSLRITITVGTNAEIVSLDPSSDPRWTVIGSTAGTNNTFQLSNTGGSIPTPPAALACANIVLKVKGTVQGGPSTITGTIGYINANNPLLGGLPNQIQGNSQTGNDNSTTSLIVTAGGNLPVRLITFTGKLVNNNRVDLDWRTAEEINVSHFDVERSLNGTDYVSIGNVNTRGANSTYDLQDLQPAMGRNFYRLRIVDLDGSVRYSNVVLINLKGKSGIVVYPSPSSDGNVNVSITGKGAKTITLNDFAGRELRKWNNYENSTLRIENLASGSYLVNVIDNQTGTRFVERFVVNR